MAEQQPLQPSSYDVTTSTACPSAPTVTQDHRPKRSSSTRKYVTKACNKCQQVRQKCDGGQPCARCISKSIDCVYRVEEDGRTRLPLKRKLDELQADSELLHALVESFKNSEDVAVAQTLSLIRSNAPLDEVRLCVQQQLVDARLQRRQLSPELEQMHHQIERISPTRGPAVQGTRQRYLDRQVFDIERLTDSPPHRVPAAPWTTVTHDDTLVSNLVSVWLIWGQPFYNWIDFDLFMRDMGSGSLGASYCSPLLVNALLAVACTYSDYAEARNRHGAPSKLIVAFLDEAERLLQEEDAEDPTITTAQALGMIFMANVHKGQDSVGFEY